MTGRRARNGRCWSQGVALAALLASGAAADAAQPTTGGELVGAVRTALETRDLEALDELVNWEGASKYRQRAVTFQLRYGLGRPIRSIALEPFPKDGFDVIEKRGTMKPNMPVSHQLRVVFDEPDNAYGKPPTALFLIGREDEAYKIALVVPTEKPKDDD